MNSITATYPAFQSLPKGLKGMLVVSESLFFEDAKTSPEMDNVEHRPGFGHATIADSQRPLAVYWPVESLSH